jgi:hypothetical protein
MVGELEFPANFPPDKKSDQGTPQERNRGPQQLFVQAKDPTNPPNLSTQTKF